MSPVLISLSVITVLFASSMILLWATGYKRFVNIKWIAGDGSLAHRISYPLTLIATIITICTTVFVGVTTHV